MGIYRDGSDDVRIKSYQFQVIGRIDKLDRNVVLGLFTYPTLMWGKDKTNEIDIEFAQWGNPAAKNADYVVYPTSAVSRDKNIDNIEFWFALNGDYTTHRFLWESSQVTFQSLHGHRGDDHRGCLSAADGSREASRAARRAHRGIQDRLHKPDHAGAVGARPAVLGHIYVTELHRSGVAQERVVAWPIPRCAVMRTIYSTSSAGGPAQACYRDSAAPFSGERDSATSRHLFAALF
jgi:hypothetical protein